ncbi:MAG: 2-dehydro-3-deoxygalactonokinase [Hyphomicrobiaceae bacterium]|nr:2-dehydro-3-deoxygalactonokinase [Hyphomicrobiaceae bacterium]
MDKASWVGIDWGTSNVRAWSFGADGAILASAALPKGMAMLASPDYPGVLSELLTLLRFNAAAQDFEVLVCGMAGARAGWHEAGYLDVPADLAPLGRSAVRIPSSPDLPRVDILPGVAVRTPGAEDVMRGEETQLLGLLRLHPGFEGTACLPGTHSKWANISGGRLTGFATAMTGELFEALSTHTVLRHSMPVELIGEDTEAGIADGLAAGLERPEALLHQLFVTRAATLVAGKSQHWASGYLSGLLVGTEVATLAPANHEAPIAVIGAPRLQRLYCSALAKRGLQSITIDATEATIAGLKAAREHVT